MPAARDKLDLRVAKQNVSLCQATVAALRSVQAAQAAGVPVLAGGRAFGPDDPPAHRLGADGWAPDADAAGRLLGEWRRQPSSVGTRPVGMRDAEPLELEAAVSELFLRFPALAGDSQSQLARTREDLGYILQFLEAALLTDDPRIFLDEFLPWLTRVLTSRGLPAGVINVGPGSARSSAGRLPRGRELIVRGRQLAADRAPDG